jgi:hypothetical protein
VRLAGNAQRTGRGEKGKVNPKDTRSRRVFRRGLELKLTSKRTGASRARVVVEPSSVPAYVWPGYMPLWNMSTTAATHGGFTRHDRHRFGTITGLTSGRMRRRGSGRWLPENRSGNFFIKYAASERSCSHGVKPEEDGYPRRLRRRCGRRGVTRARFPRGKRGPTNEYASKGVGQSYNGTGGGMTIILQMVCFGTGGVCG